MKPKTEHLWDYENLSKFLKVKPSVIKYWVKNREIPFIKIGRYVRFDEQEIKEWIEDRKMREYKLRIKS